MAEDDARERDHAKEILEGWSKISKEYSFGGLSEQEEAQFERAQFAEKQASRTSFVLGEPINHRY